MIEPSDWIQIVADSLFGGNVTLCGLIIYAIVLALAFTFSKGNTIVGFVVMLPLTLVFAMMNVIPTSLTIILIVVAVLGLSISARKSAGGDL